MAESSDDLMFLKVSATGSVSCRFLMQFADQEDPYLVSKLCIKG